MISGCVLRAWFRALASGGKVKVHAIKFAAALGVFNSKGRIDVRHDFNLASW
jgi:hypothetical protein